MKNVWTMARWAMNDDMATAMLGNVLRVHGKVDHCVYKFRRLDVWMACYGLLLKEGWTVKEFMDILTIPAFSKWFEAVVDEIWAVNFEPKVTKAV